MLQQAWCICCKGDTAVHVWKNHRMSTHGFPAHSLAECLRCTSPSPHTLSLSSSFLSYTYLHICATPSTARLASSVRTLAGSTLELKLIFLCFKQIKNSVLDRSSPAYNNGHASGHASRAVADRFASLLSAGRRNWLLAERSRFSAPQDEIEPTWRCSCPMAP
jgi:hypothetical protein